MCEPVHLVTCAREGLHTGTPDVLRTRACSEFAEVRKAPNTSSAAHGSMLTARRGRWAVQSADTVAAEAGDLFFLSVFIEKQ